MPIDTAALICAAAQDLGLAPFVRIPEREYGVIGRLLDGGVLGIIAPRVETAEEAQDIVAACRFPPFGHRSAVATLAHLDFQKLPAAEFNAALNRATVVKILLESPRGRGDRRAARRGHCRDRHERSDGGNGPRGPVPTSGGAEGSRIRDCGMPAGAKAFGDRRHQRRCLCGGADPAWRGPVHVYRNRHRSSDRRRARARQPGTRVPQFLILEKFIRHAGNDSNLQTDA